MAVARPPRAKGFGLTVQAASHLEPVFEPVIEKAGFTTNDDIVHGYGGGYFPPVLGSRSRPAGPIPDMTLEAGMTLVVQPNVITKDARAGVQVGELVHITEHGFERLHKAPRALFRVA